ncbi:MAG TPA: ATP-binding protein [Verrucomicrobiae bacterium]|nr:ATP-binding protein [Verrucomicrobiae bacterium]
MTLRFPLYAKILLWFFLNLAALGVAFYIFFHSQFQLGLNWLIAGQAGNRIQAVSRIITDELNNTDGREQWDAILERFGNSYRVRFYLFQLDGRQIAGEPIELPRRVANVLAEQRRPPVERERAGGVSHHFMERVTDPVRYWVGIGVPVRNREQLTLLAVSDSISGGGLFLDTTPWVMIGFGALVFSVLLWLPLVRGITHSIAQMTGATEQIAAGNFDIRVNDRRWDELGRLGQAINRMTGRLAGFVTGQKRFLGDVAHELCSPLARIQVALGILEQRADEKQRTAVEDVREEVQHMSNLVNELLSFSKAGLREREIQLQPVRLAEIARRVVTREAEGQVGVEIPEDLYALAEPDLLARALANLVRNALRYGSGPVAIHASVDTDTVCLIVADSGPGVPDKELQQIFDPFYRLETSRSRETGGIGLGLAIVKTCIQACRGTVTARNRQPTGLEVEICLHRSSQASHGADPLPC